jgi:hypothetical protein
MPSEQVMEVLVRRHVFDSDRPFGSVLDGVFGGISQPDIELLFSKLKASTSYEEFSSLVAQAQDRAGRRLVRLIAGNPVTMGEMTRHVADAGSYAPVTILIEETREGGTRVAYDSVASAIAPYHDASAAEVAQRLDTEVLDLLRQVTGTTGSGRV